MSADEERRNGDRIDAWLIGSIRDDLLAISTVALTLQLADSRGSLCSPKAGFGRIRLLPRRAAYGLSCELTQPAMSGRTAPSLEKRPFDGAIVKGWSMPARASVGARLRWDEGQASSKPRGRKPRVVLRWSVTARRYGDWNWGGAAGVDGGSAGLGAHRVMLASMRARMTGFGNTIPIADAISMSGGKAPPSRRLGVMRRRGRIGVQSRLGHGAPG